MKINIYIATSGGVINGVRADIPNRADNGVVEWGCFIVDYDDHDSPYGAPDTEGMTEEEFERSRLDGHTWDELELITHPVY
jgi:hypothetical protein